MKKGDAVSIANGISNSFSKEFNAVGCDGTVVNTGSDGGVIHFLEIYVGRPMQWLICQLHFTELPFRALFHHIDGDTTGPNSFSGEIGSALKTSMNLEVVKFKRIPGTLPPLFNEMDIRELSTDQQYLYEIVQAVSSGVCSQSLAERSTGKICNSRWLTLANNCLRLYIGTLKPSRNLVDIVTYIMKVYAPMWFRIKMNNKCVDAAKNLFHYIEAISYLKPVYRTVIEASIQRNGFYAHPENILIAMLQDDQEQIRRLAFDRIRKARSTSDASTIRRFTVPAINFKAKTYYNLIDWTKVNITEPPLTKDLSLTELQTIVNLGSSADVSQSPIFRLPCHTQSVERTVKLVTEASQRVADEVRRDGYIRAILSSREKMPQFTRKGEFTV